VREVNLVSAFGCADFPHFRTGFHACGKFVAEPEGGEGWLRALVLCVSDLLPDFGQVVIAVEVKVSQAFQGIPRIRARPPVQGFGGKQGEGLG
jgi:hypothetical protein